MSIREKMLFFTKKLMGRQKEMDPEKAYDLWALRYDEQPGNLTLDLDNEIFTGFLDNVELEQKIVADIGCGTGRHWEKILARHPAQLLGFDVSEGMLAILNQKFPTAETHQLKSNSLSVLANNSCDIIVSTLALAHIKNAGEALAEWARVLKPGGDIILTDYHPAMLMQGGNRTFRVNNQLLAVKNYIHPLEQIKAITRQLGLYELRFYERIIDESVKHYYEQQNAETLYERFKNVPVIYGIHLKKDR